MADYQGWRNSATFLTNQYLQQEASLYEQIVALHQAGVLTEHTLRNVAPIKVNQDEEAACGYIRGTVYLDSWAEGEVCWAEMVANWQTELGSKT